MDCRGVELLWGVHTAGTGLQQAFAHCMVCSLQKGLYCCKTEFDIESTTILTDKNVFCCNIQLLPGAGVMMVVLTGWAYCTL